MSLGAPLSLTTHVGPVTQSGSSLFLLPLPDKGIEEDGASAQVGARGTGRGGRAPGHPPARTVQTTARSPPAVPAQGCRVRRRPCWPRCRPQPHARPLPAEFSTLQAVQASMILSTTLCCVSFLVFLLQLFRLRQGERFVLTSIIQLMSCE